MYVAKRKYSKYAKDGMFIVDFKNAKYTEEAVFSKEGHNKLLANEGNDEPLSKDGNWAGFDNEPLATRAIGPVSSARQQ
jgi:hypothetical protein